MNHRVLGTVERLRELEAQRNESQNELDTIETHLKEFVEENLAYTNKLISEATLPAEIPNVHTLRSRPWNIPAIQAVCMLRSSSTAWASRCHQVSTHISWSEATQDSFS